MGKLSVSITLVALLMGLCTGTGVEGKISSVRRGRGRRHRVNPDGSSETYYPVGAQEKGKPSATKIRFTGGGPKGHTFVKNFEFPSSGSGPWPPHKPDPTPDPCYDLGPCETCVNGKKVAADYGTSCSDGIFCNGEERCNSYGQCVPGDAVDCSGTAFGDIALDCGEAYCNEYAKECQVDILKGRHCDDPDLCTEGGTCQHDGSCRGTPKHCAGCTECDPYSGSCEHTCESHETCKHDKCVAVHPFPHHGCGAKLCFNHVCTWSHCGDCEVCEYGKCVPKECGDCHFCEHNQCVAKECGDCHVCEGNECVEQEHCGGKSYAIDIAK